MEAKREGKKMIYKNNFVHIVKESQSDILYLWDLLPGAELDDRGYFSRLRLLLPRDFHPDWLKTVRIFTCEKRFEGHTNQWVCPGDV